MKKKVIILVVIALILLGGGAGGTYYYAIASKYINTEDARIQGDLRAIGAPGAGKLIEWNYKEGDSFNKGDVLGLVETTPAHGNTPAVTQEIIAAEEGTIIQFNGIKDQMVSPSSAIAMSANLDQLYVSANLQETEIADVKVGSKVTIKIDAYPNTTITGHVERLGLGTNSSFSLLPTSNTTGNFTKVIQRIPVKISLDDHKGLRLVPGLNVTVKIEK
ncbi:efflux RND transporter periplasmic adaptor subunit [Paenibacillus doosanensis]|uniref:Multidrug export protein EmrA n=1 Tax=Paenibacillus konkukensis TaxID=2020716 RepID=A0ABY4RK58_9BACL|nr:MULTISPECIES: efflux RND transporter periplasmic adaptor subunit [Paenibacillus]MCS7462656.1 efflux RND transporter periplasmic adaptor subunit [Paenibacillus doosanensis]UQZ82523.1 Multidrug export protein EmrA [Paenibacillus konkukensis]